MAKYRKRPVVIDAWRNVDGGETIPDWMTADHIQNLDGGRVAINTKEGTMVAEMGDYIIRGVAGEVYPCKPEIFAATYDLVTE